MENTIPYYKTEEGKEEKKRQIYERHYLYAKEMREVAKELGKCSKCFKEKDNPKFKYCSKCREYHRNYYHNQKGGNHV